jgi:hypothetical protein
MGPAKRTVGWGIVLGSRQVRMFRSCLLPPSSEHRITTLLCTWCENLKVQGELQNVSFIVSTSLAVLLHRKPASAGTSHESVRALGTMKETLRTLAWHTPKINFGYTRYVPNFIEIRCRFGEDRKGRAISLPRYVTILYTYWRQSMKTVAYHYKLLFYCRTFFEGLSSSLKTSNLSLNGGGDQLSALKKDATCFVLLTTLRGATSQKISRYLNI